MQCLGGPPIFRLISKSVECLCLDSRGIGADAGAFPIFVRQRHGHAEEPVRRGENEKAKVGGDITTLRIDVSRASGRSLIPPKGVCGSGRCT